jgi:hypothetical protein
MPKYISYIYFVIYKLKDVIKVLFYIISGAIISILLSVSVLRIAILQILFIAVLNWYLKNKTTISNKQREIVIFLLFILNVCVFWINM